MDIIALEGWVNAFPFFPLASMCLCKKYQQIYNSQNEKEQELKIKLNLKIKYTASIIPSRVVFQNFLRGQIQIKENILSKNLNHTEKNINFILKPLPSKNSTTNRIGHYDIEHLYPEDNRETLDDWLNSLKTKRLTNATTDPRKGDSKKKKLAVMEEDEDLVSETLVKIYELQENWKKAIHAYGVLIKKFPENKNIYQKKIEEIKEKSQEI